MDKLPRVYKNPINKNFNNTQNESKSSLRSIKKDINNEINMILKNHIVKSRVRVTLQNKVLDIDLIGRTNNSIITLNNGIININDILDIEEI